ncbi:rhamnosyltransferase WsaF family glycosyltransferase [Geodermatophilus nigrescens]
MASTISKAVRVARSEGLQGVGDRLIRAAAQRWSVPSEWTGLDPADVVDAASVRVPPRHTRPRDAPLEIGWVLTPPGAGSGGHTTIFRMVEALESAGHRCTLFLYGGRQRVGTEYEAVIRRWWPAIRAPIRDLRDGLPDMDAHVATAWPTAHALARRGDAAGARLYFVQDFEPYFYARGSDYALAEETYRFGFQVISVGHMVADELERRFGISSTVTPFGCDQDVYRVLDGGPRDEVVFYARPGVARRGYDLGVQALEHLSAAKPDVVIHTFGVSARRLPFPARVHAALTPQQLNELYNRCAAGLALSFTNISLIAYELLAAGVVPVVNDWTGSRADLDNPFVEWATPTPAAVSRSLLQALDRHRSLGPKRISASVEAVTWRDAQRTVVRTIEAACSQVSRRDGPCEGVSPSDDGNS